MPDFVTPLSRLGSNAGFTAGGILGGTLSGIGDVLSMPRRLLWKGASGLFGKDVESGDDLMNLVGLDAENPLVHALGIGAEVAFDPLTYTGGLLGKLGGAMTGSRLGKAAEAAAIARGPRYGGGLAKLAEAGIPETEDARKFVRALTGSADAERVLQEVPPGSKWLHAGTQAGVFTTPAGDTIRIAPGVRGNLDRMARADISEMLPAHRAGMVDDFRIERAPLADTAPFGGLNATHAGDPTSDAVGAYLGRRVSDRGYDPIDIWSANMGMYRDKPVLIDPGALAPRAGGPTMPLLPDWKARRPGRAMNWLLDRLGADQKMQAELEQAARAAM